MLDRVQICKSTEKEIKRGRWEEILYGVKDNKRLFNICKYNDYDIGILADDCRLDKDYILGLLKELKIDYTYRTKHDHKWYGLYSNEDYEKIKMYFNLLGILKIDYCMP